MDDLLQQLQPLVEARYQAAKERDAADARYQDLGDQIGALMIAHGVEKLRVADFNVSVGTGSRASISKDRLVELGVGTDVIAAATKTSQYAIVNVRLARDASAGKEAA